MAKALKNIKAFIPFTLGPGLHAWCGKAARAGAKTAREAVEHFVAADPAAHEWSNLGLTEVMPGEDHIVHDLDGAGFLLLFRFTERKLPASVRDEELHKRYLALVEKEGRPLNKKEFAQLRDDVESSLLPKAFIVPKTVPVIVMKKRMFVCTSSATMCDKIITHLHRMCEARKVVFDWSDMMTAVSPSSMLTRIAREAEVHVNDHDETIIAAGTSAVFKGENNNAVRVKDRDLSHAELTDIINGGVYAATELALILHQNDNVVMSLTLTDKFIFKAIKLSDVMVAGTGIDVADLHATYWLFAKEIDRMLTAVTSVYMEGQDDDHPDQSDDDEL